MAEGDTPWFEALDPETKAHATTKGWAVPDPAIAAAAAIKAHYGAEKFVGHPADQLLKLPKDAADPSYADVYKRVVDMSMPKDPSEYKFDEVKFRDGTPLGDDEAAFVRSVAVKYGIPIVAAKGLAAELAARADTYEEASTRSAVTTRDANVAGLRSREGANFDTFAGAVIRAAEVVGLPKSVLEHINGLPQAEYQASMDALHRLGTQMNEAAILRGGGGRQFDPTVGMSAVEARTELERLQADPAWRTKFVAQDATAVDTWQKLTRIMVPQR